MLFMAEGRLTFAGVLYFLSALMAEGRLTFAGVLYYLSDFHGGVLINIGRGAVRSI